MFSIGPGLKSATAATKSFMFSGFKLLINFFIPCDSNWNTPSKLPFLNKSYVLLSSSGISLNLMFAFFITLSIIVR